MLFTLSIRINKNLDITQYFIILIEKIKGVIKLHYLHNLNINQNLTETDINDIDINSQLKHQIQIQEAKDSGWIVDKINSMEKSFHKTGKLNGSN